MTIEAHDYAARLHDAIARAFVFAALPISVRDERNLQDDAAGMQALLRQMEVWADENSN